MTLYLDTSSLVKLYVAESDSDRVRAHVFLCMLAYYLACHLRHVWKPLIFDDEQPPTHP